jgi:putative phage-type endonuclease
MLVLTSTDGMSEQEWLELRRKGLGGSDVATAMGLSPWKSPMQLYLEKTGEIDPEPLTSEVVYWGTVLESVIANRFAELHPESPSKNLNRCLSTLITHSCLPTLTG